MPSAGSSVKAVYVAESIFNTLMAVCSMNVLHWDISLDNIMVCKDGKQSRYMRKTDWRCLIC